jgi:L-alanine-DL-glutamate epimerase-like enolase superfamily enzyme
MSRVTSIELRPLRLAYKQPFHWAQGVITAAEVILVEIHTDDGLIGYGECMSAPSADSVIAALREASALIVGQDPGRISLLISRCYQKLFMAHGNCSAPRYGALVLAGLEMALWDLLGKATGRAVHELLGGAVRERIDYFGFPQGETPRELAEDAARWAKAGCKVIYVKIGRGEELDLEIAARVREAIGNRRLRLDANESWDVLTARRMIRRLERFDVEFIEQPTRCDSPSALTSVERRSRIGLAADQRVFTPEDVFEVCREGAADLIVLGLHETGGISRFCQAAAIANAAGRNICLHGLYETGITTCASHQVGAVIPNLDDGNQYMNHLLVEDIILKPDLTLSEGSLPLLGGPGLGFELDMDAVARAERAFKASRRQR